MLFLSAFIQGLLILLFLFLGWLRPRLREPVWLPDTWLNVATGLSLFGFRVSLMAWLIDRAAWARRGLIDLNWLENPWLEFTVAFVVQDLARYGLHVAHHRVPWLWRFHRVHHSCEHLNATAGLRMHLADFFQLNAIPVVLFGLVFDCSEFPSGVWLGISAMVTGFDAYQHANLAMTLRGRLARWWNTLFVNPCFHSWHHARDWRKYNGNYGQALALWDHLFGTSVDEVEACTDVGLPPDQDLEPSFWGLQLLRPRRRPDGIPHRLEE